MLLSNSLPHLALGLAQRHCAPLILCRASTHLTALARRSYSTRPHKITRLSDQERTEILNEALFLLSNLPNFKNSGKLSDIDKNEIIKDVLSVLSSMPQFNNNTNTNNNDKNNFNNFNKTNNQKRTYKKRKTFIEVEAGNTWVTVGFIFLGAYILNFFTSSDKEESKPPTPEQETKPKTPTYEPLSKKDELFPIMDANFTKWAQNALLSKSVIDDKDEMVQACRAVIANIEAVFDQIGNKKDEIINQKEISVLPVKIQKLVLIRDDVPAIHTLLDGTMYISSGIFKIVNNESELASLITHQLVSLSSRRKKNQKGIIFETFLYDFTSRRTDTKSIKILPLAKYDPIDFPAVWARIHYLEYDSPLAINNCHPLNANRRINQISWARSMSYEYVKEEKKTINEKYSFPKFLLSFIIALPPDREAHADFWEKICTANTQNK